VFAEEETIPDFDHILILLRIVVTQVFQYFDFHHGLLVETFTVSNYFERTHFLPFVVKCLHYLPKTAFAQRAKDFLPLCNLVLHQEVLIAFFVILTKIEFEIGIPIEFSTFMPDEVDIFILLNF